MRGFCPRAILFNRANTILLQVAAPADLALCDRFEAGHVWALSRAGLIASSIERACRRLPLPSRNEGTGRGEAFELNN